MFRRVNARDAVAYVSAFGQLWQELVRREAANR
jgi:hypothetical protein